MAQDRTYWCFISYRHVDNRDVGRQWATWLHQHLETYEVPQDLVGATSSRGDVIPARIFPVFRDEDELEPGDLNQKIYRALDHSKVLIVICSPRVLASTYVSNEIRYFKRLGKSDRIFAAIVDGEPSAAGSDGCFPEALRYEVDDQGQMDTNRRMEPLAADFRLLDGAQGWTNPEAYREQLSHERQLTKAEIERTVGSYRERLDRSKLQLVASVLGVPFGTLQQRDQAYQLALSRRKATVLRRWVTALITLAISAVGAAFYANVQRKEAVQRALIATSSALSHRSRNVVEAQADLGLLLAAESYQTFDTYEARFALLSAITHRPQLRMMAHVDRGQVTAICQTHDGRIVAAANGDGSIVFFSSATLEPLGAAMQAHSESIKSAVCSPTANLLATAAKSDIRFWDVERRAPLSPVLQAGLGDVSMLSFSFDGKVLASAHRDGIALWDVPTQRVTSQLEDSQNSSTVAFSPNAKLLVAGDYGAFIRVWDLPGGGRRIGDPIPPAQRFASSVAFSPDNRVLAVGGSSPDIALWDVQTRRPARASLATPSGRTFVAFDRTTHKLAAGDNAGIVSVWPALDSLTELNPEVQTLRAHRSSVNGVMFNDRGRFLFSGGSDGKLIKWSTDDINPIGRSILDNAGRIASAHGTDLFAIARNDGEIVLWDVAAASRRHLAPRLRDDSDSFLVFSHDDRLLAAVDRQELVIWDLAQSRVLTRAARQGDKLLVHVAFTRDDRLIVWDKGHDDTLNKVVMRLWTIDPASGREIGVPRQFHFQWDPSAAALSDDGLLLAVTNEEQIELRNVETGHISGRPIPAGAHVGALRFSPDGHRLAIGTDDRRIVLWDIRSAQALGEFRGGHRSDVNNIAFSGRFLASSGTSPGRYGSTDGDIFLWDLSTHQPIGQLLRGRQLGPQFFHLTFSPSGTTLLSSGGDATWLWDVNPASWRSIALRMANRPLTADQQ